MAATAATAKFKIASLSCPKVPVTNPSSHFGKFFRLQDVVDDYFYGPRLGDVCYGFAEDRDQSDGQPLPMRPEKVRDPELSGERAFSRIVVHFLWLAP